LKHKIPHAGGFCGFVDNLLTTSIFEYNIKLSTSTHMDIKKIILDTLAKSGKTKVSDLVRVTGFSRAYLNRFFRELRDEKRIILVGKANSAHYVRAGKGTALPTRMHARAHRVLKNKNLSEDVVLSEIKEATDIFVRLPGNVAHILDYAFTEMLNNAIEHSKSDKVEVLMKRDIAGIRFDVIDKGIGIFKNIMQKKKLPNELEAIRALIKGKQTTAPREHTGEGIFFTSKAGDMLIIQSSKKKLIFNNTLKDIFIRDIKMFQGTKVTFTLGVTSKKNLDDIFKEYTEDSFVFNRTEVIIKLYAMDTDYISRSQARRVLNDLEKFKTVILDFKDVDTIGQAFADEVFRVWQKRHPKISIAYKNTNENILLFVERIFVLKRWRPSGGPPYHSQWLKLYVGVGARFWEM